MPEGEFPDPPSEDEIEARMKAFKQRLSTDLNRTEPKKGDLNPTESHNLALGMSAAYILIGMPLAGALLGWLIDRSLGGQVFTALGVLLGSTFAIFHVLQMMKRQK